MDGQLQAAASSQNVSSRCGETTTKMLDTLNPESQPETPALPPDSFPDIINPLPLLPIDKHEIPTRSITLLSLPLVL